MALPQALPRINPCAPACTSGLASARQSMPLLSVGGLSATENSPPRLPSPFKRTSSTREHACVHTQHPNTRRHQGTRARTSTGLGALASVGGIYQDNQGEWNRKLAVRSGGIQPNPSMLQTCQPHAHEPCADHMSIASHVSHRPDRRGADRPRGSTPTAPFRQDCQQAAESSPPTPEPPLPGPSPLRPRPLPSATSTRG